MENMENTRPVMVTTDKKGVFFGYINNDVNINDASIEMYNSRMCVYWSEDMKGILGLCNMGPSSSCRIGPKVPKITLNGLTAIVEPTAKAVKKWEAAPWG